MCLSTSQGLIDNNDSDDDDDDDDDGNIFDMMAEPPTSQLLLLELFAAFRHKFKLVTSAPDLG